MTTEKFKCTFQGTTHEGKVIRFQDTSDDLFFTFQGEDELRIPLIDPIRHLIPTLVTMGVARINKINVDFDTGKIALDAT